MNRREKVARALHERFIERSACRSKQLDELASVRDYDTLSPGWKRDYLADADAVLDALHLGEGVGWIAPWGPTEAIKRALIKNRGLDPDAVGDGSILEHVDLMTIQGQLDAFFVIRDAHLANQDSTDG